MQELINAQFNLVGLIGNPIKHSLSPLLHNYLFNMLNIKAVYLAFPVENHFLERAVQGLVALNAKGFNVTIPYKESIIPFLNKLDDLAKDVGAVNTVVIDQGTSIGYNTDVSGFLKSLKKNGFDPKDKVTAVIGTGGAARAAIIGLLHAGSSQVHIIGRNIDKAQQIFDIYANSHANKLKVIEIDKTASVFEQCALIVNATPIGMYGYLEKSMPLSEEYIPNQCLIYDMVYNPLETVLLKKAKSKGCQVINGLDMLIYQGADAFKLWTGIEPPIDLIYDFLKKHVTI